MAGLEFNIKNIKTCNKKANRAYGDISDKSTIVPERQRCINMTMV